VKRAAGAEVDDCARRVPLADLVAVGAFKALVSAFVLSTSFRALSDDDYARVVIAERFAHAPHLDPSGTSWLPLPFWVNGGALALFGRSLETARATAFVLGVAAALLVYVAARWLGAARPGAIAGALMACALPYAAWLGVATVPDGPTAALIVVGAAAAWSEIGARRALGALALAAACLSRYEAWPVAAGFALFMVWDAMRGRSRRDSWFAAACAAVGPIAWMIHGAFAHGSALFFVERVVAYRRALGVGTRSLVHYPLALFRAEPEIAGVVLVSLCAVAALHVPGLRARYRRFAWLGAALVAFLVASELRGGAPTQHPERVLLAAWLGGAVFAGDALFCAWARLGARGRALVAGSALAVLALGAGWLRPRFAAPGSFARRSDEVAVGRAARRAVSGSGRLLVDTPDYGFFAVIASFGAPERAAPLDDRDPRNARPPDAFVSSATLRARLDAAGASWLVASGAHRAVARQVGSERAADGPLALFEVAR
jgi:Dolichyl-phosphate-mannose-protein mannosyltransferase